MGHGEKERTHSSEVGNRARGAYDWGHEGLYGQAREYKKNKRAQEPAGERNGAGREMPLVLRPGPPGRHFGLAPNGTCLISVDAHHIHIPLPQHAAIAYCRAATAWLFFPS